MLAWSTDGHFQAGIESTAPQGIQQVLSPPHSQGPAASAERQSCSSTEAASAPQQSGEAASFPAALLASSKQTRKT